MKRSPYSTFFLASALLVLLDLWTKSYFDDKTYLQGSFFYIFPTQNTGSAFSLFSSVATYNTIIIIFSLLLLLGFALYHKRIFAEKSILVPSILFISGLLGNLYDRIVFGYVRDFLGVKYFSIFNFADIYLTLCAVFLILREISENKALKTKKTRKSQ